MDFYVYVHKKKSNGEVFYVGKGSGKRAWSSFGRNELWKRTANKYGWYVEIVENNLQDWYAFELERDLISFYGRRDIGDGILTNMSDGGDGPSRMNPEAAKRISEALSGINCYKADQKDYTFYNVKTKEIFKGKRVNFETTFGIKIRRLFASRNIGKSMHLGWVVVEHLTEGQDLDALSLRDISGEKNPNADKNIYEFFNIHTMERFIGTRFQIEEALGVNTGTLFYTGTSYKSWAVFNNQTDEELDRLRFPTKYLGLTKRDSRHLSLVHKDGLKFNGTRQEFKEKYGFDLNHLLRKTEPARQQKGWSLSPQQPE